MKDKLNNPFTGIISGIIMPPFAFYIFCLISYRDESAIDLLKGFAARHVITHVISLAVIVNLPLFFGFLGSNRDRSALGVIIATILYGLVIVFLKYFV